MNSMDIECETDALLERKKTEAMHILKNPPSK